MKKYLYAVPGVGYVSGQGCTNKKGDHTPLEMVSHNVGPDQPGTSISYIRPVPVGIPESVMSKIDRYRGDVLRSMDADEAIELLKSRGRTLEEIKDHPKKFGITIIMPEDIAETAKTTTRAQQRRKFALDKEKKAGNSVQPAEKKQTTEDE